jgi:hypothetical protein
MRDFTTELYIYHEVRKIPRVDGNGASLALCIAWGVMILEGNLILDEHV